MGLTATQHSDIEHVEQTDSDKDVKIGQSSPTYPSVPYQH